MLDRQSDSVDQNVITPKRRYFIAFTAIIILASLSLLFYQEDLSSSRAAMSQCEASVHDYINPDLDCINTDLAFKHINNSQKKTRAYIAQEISSGHAKRISVFYRDLETKKWYGENENDTFSPGSILKLPLAIAYFKYEEFDPSVNKFVFTFDRPNELNSLENFNTARPLIPGARYSVDDFLIRLLVDSDNAVVPLLVDGIDKNFYNKVMIDLGVSIPLPENGGTHADFFSAKSYAAIFRMLYNASYLSIGQSEEVLELLSRSTFTKGLVAGVPPGTKVAHKFGEATQVDQDSGKIVKRELHDCGVIYKEKSSYILCVMTEGSDFDSLENIIASISRITWDTSELTDESE